MKITNTLIVVAALSVSSAFAQTTITYTTRLLSVHGLTSTQATSINHAEEIVGSGVNTAGATIGFIILPDGTSSLFSAPGATATYPAHINDAGQIVGSYEASSVSGTFNSHGFIDNTTVTGTPGHYALKHSFQTVDVPSVPSGNTYLTGINISGFLVGYAGLPPAGTTHGSATPGFEERGGKYTFLYGNNLYTDVNAINDSGEIVGSTDAPQGFAEGFIYNNGAYTYFSFLKNGGYSYVPTAINNEGKVLLNVTATSCCGTSGTYLWQAGVAAEAIIPIPAGSLYFSANGFNERNQIVGAFLNAAGTAYTSFLATPK